MAPKRPIAALLVLAFSIGGIHLARQLTGFDQLVIAGEPTFYRSKGNPRAELKITEFIDFQCGACAEGAKIIRKYFEKYPGKILIELKHFPLRMHKNSVPASFFAECAAEQQKFWEFHDLLIDQQKEWDKLENAVPAFEAMARYLELNLDQIGACLNNQEMQQTVQDNITEGEQLGIQFTPTYLINGERVVGFRPLQDYLQNYFGETPDVDTNNPQVPNQ